MKELKKTYNCMNYDTMLHLYEKIKDEKNDLEIDMKFLSDTYLGRYESYILDKLNLPDNIYKFLNEVGLPNRFFDWRSPDEELECKNQTGYLGMIFSLRCLHIEKVKGKNFLVIGECYNIGRYEIISQGKRSCWKDESIAYIIVEIKTGKVYQLIKSFNEDFISYINSSLEQFVLSMACWKSFYPIFAEKVIKFKEENPEKTEIDYIFKNEKKLYQPFLNSLRILDNEAMRKRNCYWKFMCDLSLY